MRSIFLVVSIILLYCANATATERTELSVAGKIAPAACGINLANGGVLDLGAISASVISMIEPTPLPEVVGQMKIVCVAPTRFAFKIIDNRAATRVEDIGLGCYGSICNFGMGAINGINIGAYYLSVSDRDVKDEVNLGDPPNVVNSNDAGASWNPYAAMYFMPNTWNGFSTNHSTSPTPYQSVSALFRAAAVINTGFELPLANEIPIDGSATFELIYL